MVALLLVALLPLVMWTVQGLLLRQAGQGWRMSLGGSDLPRAVKRGNRVTIYASFAALLVVYPLLRGHEPLAYYGRFFPTDRVSALGWGVFAAVLYLVLLYLAWYLTGNVHFERRDPPARLARHFLGVPLTAVFAALAEELLFRAVVLADLLRTMDVRIAVPIAVVVFAAAHYVRRVKRYWTFPGHLALGTLFCLAFVWTGNLWLPLGLHAGGIVILMGLRPVVRYTGPAWLVGASIFPYAGVPGIAALMALMMNVWHWVRAAS